MKKQGYLFLFLIKILILLPTAALLAQDSEVAQTLTDGSKAIQFRIGENFNLTSFTGSVLSYKWHRSSDRANRIGISLGNSFSSTDYPEDEDELLEEDFDINLFARYTWMHYTNPESIIKHYFGYGPGFNFFYMNRLSENSNARNITKNTSLGLYGLVYTGVEWFFHESISLHAEYEASLSVRSRWNKQETEIIDTGEVTETRRNTISYNLGGEGVRFGISLYF